MPIFKSICRLEKKLWHFENLIFFLNWKCSKHRIPTDADSTMNHFVVRSILLPIRPWGPTLENRGVLHSVWPGPLWTDFSPVENEHQEASKWCQMNAKWFKINLKWILKRSEITIFRNFKIQKFSISTPKTPSDDRKYIRAARAWGVTEVKAPCGMVQKWIWCEALSFRSASGAH